MVTRYPLFLRGEAVGKERGCTLPESRRQSAGVWKGRGGCGEMLFKYFIFLFFLNHSIDNKIQINAVLVQIGENKLYFREG